jgi:hypothetical protein
MCWRHGPGRYWTPDPEAPEIVEAREELLDSLEAVAREVPGDAWVLGQRAWYLGESGDWGAALVLARSCGLAARWWCAALEGLALHRLGRYVEAQARFESALDSLDPDLADRWRDPVDLLDPDGRAALGRARDGGRRSEFLNRLWSYADPLWIVPGNDRLSEHYARRTVAKIREEARNPHGISWGSDMEELLLRYGWAVGWERVSDPPASILERQGVVSHEHPESRSFVPAGRLLTDPLARDAEEWVPGLTYAPSAYAPAYAPIFLPFPSVLSVIPLGDSVVVVATYRLPEDTTEAARSGLREGWEYRNASGPPEAGLALRTLDGEQVSATRVGGRRAGVLARSVPPGSYVASVEVWDPDAGLAGRHRVALEAPSVPPGIVALSDLLLLEEGPDPEALQDAVSRVLPSLELRAGGTVRVAWVVAGLGLRDEVLSYRLSLEETDRGFFRRAGEWLGWVGGSEPQRLIWEEPGPARPGPVLRSVFMTLPEELPDRPHVLRLELETRGRSTLVSERRVRITPRSGDGG